MIPFERSRFHGMDTVFTAIKNVVNTVDEVIRDD